MSDIRIIPNRTTGEPVMIFSPSGITSDINLYVLTSATGLTDTGVATLSFEGSQGQLFSITDQLESGVIFSVNDIGGLPLIEADASGYVYLARYGETVGVGQSINSGVRFLVNPGLASRMGIVITGVAGQTADYFEIVNSTNNMLFAVTANGNTVIGSGIAGARLDVVDTGSNLTPTLRLMNLNANDDPYIRFTPAVTGNSFSLGIDDSDSDKFKLSFNSQLGANDRLVVATGGQVGMNNSSPTAGLDLNTLSSSTKGVIVKGSAAQSANLLELQNSSSSIVSVFDNNGNLGINTGIVGAKLHAVSTANNNIVGLFEQTHGSPQSFPVIRLSRRNNIGSPTTSGASLHIIDHPTNIPFHIETHIGNPILTVTGNGNVGLGISNPTSKLHLLGTAEQRILIQSTGNAVIQFAGVNNQNPFNITHDGTDWTLTEGIRNRIRVRNAGDISIFSRDASGIATERLTIKDLNGNIGINTNSPSARLHIRSQTADVSESGGLIIEGTGTGAVAWQLTPTASSTLLLARAGLRIAAFDNNAKFYAGGLPGPGGVGARFTASTGGITVGSGYSNINPPHQGAIIEGTVGIGTSIPVYNLDVIGTGNFSAGVRYPDGLTQIIAYTGLNGIATSGYVNQISGALDTRLVATGTDLLGRINTLSGNLITTGSNLQSQINSVSGLLYNYWTLNITGSNDQITKEQTVTFTGAGSTSVSYNSSTNTITISSTDNNTTYSAGTGLNLVGNTFNVSGSTTSNSGIVQLQDSIQDNIINRAVTPNAVFDYVATTSGAIDTRIIATGNNLQSQINSISGLTNGPVSGIAFFDNNGTLTGNNNRLVYDNNNIRLAVGTGIAGAVLDIADTGTNVIPTLRLTNLSTNFDPYIRFTPATTGNSFAVGIDDSDADKFKISYGADLGTGDIISIDTSGNVGIGTTSPDTKLEVAGVIKSSVAADNYAFEIENSSEAAFKYRIYNDGSNPVLTNTFTAGLFHNDLENAAVRFYRGSSQNGGFLAFTTNSGVERMRIDGNGNVGIGTTNINQRLAVRGGQFSVGSTDTQVAYMGADGSNVGYAGTSTNHPFQIRVNSTTRMHIATGGSVGINNTSPSDTLNINTLSSSTKGLVVQGSASQSANLSEWQNSAGSVHWLVDPNGKIGVNRSSPTYIFDVGGSGRIDTIIANESILVATQGKLHSGPVIYHFNNGIYVETNISSGSDVMIDLHVLGNSYSNTRSPISFSVQCYNYLVTGTSDIVARTYNRYGDGPTGIDVFYNTNGFLSFWFQQTASFQTYRFSLGTSSTSLNNKITNITNVAKPATLLRNYSITPFTTWNSLNDGSGSTLDADLLDGQHSSYYTGLVGTASGTLQTQINNVSGLTRGPASGIAFFAPNGTLTGISNRFIYDSGNSRLSIGTGVFGAVLDIADTGANVLPTLRLTNLANNFDPYIRFTPSTTGNSFAVGIDDSDGDKFKISYGPELGTGLGITISTSGHVGINNTTPIYPLHVSGVAVFTETIVGGIFEENASDENIKDYLTGTLLVLDKEGNLVPCYKDHDTMVFGVAKHGYKQPIVFGAEPMLVTGKVEVGDYIVTSNKIGHGMSKVYDKYGIVIGQAMESGDGYSHTIKVMIRKM